jgi:hypothetical protein
LAPWRPQAEAARLKATLESLDAFVTQTESALTLEQALNEVNELQKSDVLSRMESLVSQACCFPLVRRVLHTRTAASACLVRFRPAH